MRKSARTIWVSAFLAGALGSGCGSSSSSGGDSNSSPTESSNELAPSRAESEGASPSAAGSSEDSATRDGVSPAPSLDTPAESPAMSSGSGAPPEQTGEAQDSASDAPTSDAPPDPAQAVPSPFPLSAGKPTIYLAGDSTVQTYGAAQAPQQGWGQRIQEFFTDDVKFVNEAIGGRSSKSFIDEGRLDEIVAVLQPGDYLFAQWGINDRYRSDPTRFTDPASTFKQYLNQYVEAARSKDAIPVLVTPTPRLDFTDGAFHNDFVGYCDAIQQVAADTGTRVVDLQSKGLAYYTSIGFDAVVAEVSLPPMDVLHFQANGAFQMARLVAEGVKESDLPIAKFVK